jgi:AraC-like DNA-binding protein
MMAGEPGFVVGGGGALWSPVFESDDVELSRAHMSARLSQHALEHRRDDRPPVFRHRHAACGSLTLHELSYSMYGGDARIHVPELPGIFLFELNLFGRAELRCEGEALPFSSGNVYVCNASAPHIKRWCSDGRQLFVKIPQPTLEAALAEMIRRPVGPPVQFDSSPRPIDAWTASLANVAKLIYNDLDQGSLALVGRNAAHSAERLLIQLLLETLPNNYSHLIEAPEAPKPAYVKRAIEFIHAESDGSLALEDIVVAAGVSVRSLYEGFRRHCGQSPMAYLRGVRLDRARTELRAGAAKGVSVTEVALSCGFNHLSKFAKSYRERFGELPSETLAQGE